MSRYSLISLLPLMFLTFSCGGGNTPEPPPGPEPKEVIDVNRKVDMKDDYNNFLNISDSFSTTKGQSLTFKINYEMIEGEKQRNYHELTFFFTYKELIDPPFEEEDFCDNIAAIEEFGEIKINGTKINHSPKTYEEWHEIEDEEDIEDINTYIYVNADADDYHYHQIWLAFEDSGLSVDGTIKLTFNNSFEKIYAVCLPYLFK